MRSLRKEARPSSRMEQHEAVEGTRLCQCFFRAIQKDLFSCPSRGGDRQTDRKGFSGERMGASWASFFQATQQPLQREASETEKALAISRKGLIVWLPETDLNRQPSD